MLIYSKFLLTKKSMSKSTMLHSSSRRHASIQFGHFTKKFATCFSNIGRNVVLIIPPKLSRNQNFINRWHLLNILVHQHVSWWLFALFAPPNVHFLSDSIFRRDIFFGKSDIDNSETHKSSEKHYKDQTSPTSGELTPVGRPKYQKIGKKINTQKQK